MAEVLIIITVILIVGTTVAGVWGMGVTVTSCEERYYSGLRELAKAQGFSLEPSSQPLPSDLHETGKSRYISYGQAAGASYWLRGNWKGTETIYIPGRNRLSMRNRSGWELYSVFYFHMPSHNFPDFFLRARMPWQFPPDVPLFRYGAMYEAYPEFFKHYHIETEKEGVLCRILPERLIRHLTDLWINTRNKMDTFAQVSGTLVLWSVHAFENAPWIEIEEVNLNIDRPPQDFLGSLEEAHRIFQLLIEKADVDQAIKPAK